ncbi:sulfotransferase family protein [Flavimaricola marinus]|uniref:Sulfotransferase family protein n=1 Tax=Flavimaricola marinus TaxID=1819565 RepID=A0A238LBR8_9RHOB|nr:sulfotransferase family protein [Flavimaricola marinus]SMY07177.1 hypothetical protein LOM8899_01309 [Flavimaricola marinus]
MKIAVWSGPRNLSTAMMYAFGNRADVTAWDEPFYASYLHATGIIHPMNDAILAAQPTDAMQVIADLAQTAETPHSYFKLMTHHMLPDVPLEWAKDCINVHLIRHPARVIASYGAKRSEITSNDIGFQRQAELYDHLGGVVIDSFDVRANPQGVLERLCAAIGLPFDPAMLRWPAGARPYDGVWADHWYGAVHKSTGFAGGEGELPVLDGRDAALRDAALPHYEKLAKLKL